MDNGFGGLLCLASLAAPVFFALCGVALGGPKGRGIEGIVWGGLLGPIGLIIVLLLPSDRPQKSKARKAADLRAKIEEEERIRADVRARIEAERRGGDGPGGHG